MPRPDWLWCPRKARI